MICPDVERDATQVALEVPCSRHNCQELLPCHTVASLTFGEKMTEVPLHTLHFLQQYCTMLTLLFVSRKKGKVGSGGVRIGACIRAGCRVVNAL